jgi:hypothetical protein
MLQLMPLCGVFYSLTQSLPYLYRDVLLTFFYCNSLFHFHLYREEVSESIFKWPFKSKMNLSKKHSFNHESYSNVHRPINSTKRHEKDLATLEKNERIKRSIHEKLFASASMPDLLRQEETSKVKLKEEPKIEIKIHKGIEVTDESAQFVTVDEIQPPKRPIRAKVRRAPDPPKPPIQTPVEEVIEAIPKPPTPPVRRQSRSNSLRAAQIGFNSKLPPLVMSRKNMHQLNYVTINSVDESVITEEEPPLKSILKTGNEESHSNKTHHITFINVPDSSSEDEQDEFEQPQDIWSQIDLHRSQLKRYEEFEVEGVSRFDESESEEEELSDDDNPPPLPRTPPPISDEQPFLREFIIA